MINGDRNKVKQAVSEYRIWYEVAGLRENRGQCSKR